MLNQNDFALYTEPLNRQHSRSDFNLISEKKSKHKEMKTYELQLKLILNDFIFSLSRAQRICFPAII